MLVGVAVGELADLLRAHVHDKNVQALIVVEARHAFAGVRLKQIPSDYHGVAAGFGGFRAGSGRDESEFLAVGRPGYILARAGKRAVGAPQRSKKPDVRAVRPGHEQTVLVSLASLESQPLAVGRPQRAAARIFFPAHAAGPLSSTPHDPKPTAGPARPAPHPDV